MARGASAERRLTAYLEANLAESRGAGTVVEIVTPADIAGNPSRLKQLQNEFPKLNDQGRRGHYIVLALKDLFENPPLRELAVHVATCRGAITGAASTFASELGPDGKAVPSTQLRWVGSLKTPKGTGTALIHSIAIGSAGGNRCLWLVPSRDARAVFPRLGFIERDGFLFLPQHVVDVIASIP